MKPTFKKFNEWIKTRDPELYIILQETDMNRRNFLGFLGKAALGGAALGIADKANKAFGQSTEPEMPPKEATPKQDPKQKVISFLNELGVENDKVLNYLVNNIFENGKKHSLDFLNSDIDNYNKFKSPDYTPSNLISDCLNRIKNLYLSPEYNKEVKNIMDDPKKGNAQKNVDIQKRSEFFDTNISSVINNKILNDIKDTKYNINKIKKTIK